VCTLCSFVFNFTVKYYRSNPNQSTDLVQVQSFFIKVDMKYMVLWNFGEIKDIKQKNIKNMQL